MEHWNSVTSDTDMAIDSTAVCRLLNAIGRADHTTLANAVLELVNRYIAMADCGVMAFVAERNPRVVSVFSHTDDHQIFHCANNYARHLYQHDRIQLHLQSILPQQEIGQITVHRQTLRQIIDAELRRLYNDTMGVVDSMAITIKTGRREWITTSLCRHREQGLLTEDEIETILQLASLIATSVSSHCRLDTDGAGDYQTSVSDGIDQLCSLLTQRERQVILRILDGVTVEQIAGELGLKPTTVITYRSRAYEKLGISSRRELFSAVLRNRKGSSAWHPASIPDNSRHLNEPVYATSTSTDRSHQ
ncbi:MAG: LuxR C-terminal-related transcriptional regulator [Candidatus Thiodiazotropha sp.]